MIGVRELQAERDRLDEAAAARKLKNAAIREARREAKRAEVPPAKSTEQLEVERKQRKLRDRELKGKPLAELPVRKAVVELKVEGWTHQEVADHLGIGTSAVSRHLKNWQLAESPSEETSSQLRGLMLQRLERMHKLEWRKYAAGDEKAGELLLKVMDRTSKLMGADLQPSSTTLLISAESIARFLGWDPEPVALPKPVLEIPEADVDELEDDTDESGGGA